MSIDYRGDPYTAERAAFESPRAEVLDAAAWYVILLILLFCAH